MEDSDVHNDETFGSMSDAPPGMGGPPGLPSPDPHLPSFFSKNSGVTILDELAGLSITGGELGKDSEGFEDNIDYGNMATTFDTEEGDDYAVDEKLPDFFSSESKLYGDQMSGMKIGRDIVTPPDSFPLPAGARVIDPGSLQQPQQQQQQFQQQQQQQQQHFPMPSPYAFIPPPQQIMMCPPGALPPPQSISALSTPGQMQSWHMQQNFQPQLHPGNHYQQQQQQRQQHQQQHLQQQQQRYNNQQQFLQQQQFQQQQQQHQLQQFNLQQQHLSQMNMGPRGVAPGLSVAHGLSPLPPTPPLAETASSTARRGPPAVKGGVAPVVAVASSSPSLPSTSSDDSPVAGGLPIAAGLQQQQQQQQQGFIQPPYPHAYPPQQQFRHVVPQHQGPRLPCGSLMSPSDVRFVVGKVLQTTETHDPFNDDFYFIQLSMRRHGAKLDKAISENLPLPAPLPIPLPTWTQTKKRIRAQLDETRQHYESRSRKWEIQEKVLGHNVKSDVSKPRAVLSVPRPEPARQPNGTECGGGGGGSGSGSNNSLDDMINGLDEEIEEVAQAAITPFTTVLWNMRGAVYRGYGALYVAQELRQLLNTPLVNAPNNSAVRADIIQEAEAAVALVCKSVGLKDPTNALTASTDFLSKIQMNSTSGVLLDGGLVAALLQTTKGKKLMRRSICLLQAGQRWTLLPVLVARILQRDPGEQSKEDVDVEASLLSTIIDFIQYEEDCIVNRRNVDMGVNIPPSVLLIHLRQCIKSVMVSQMETKQLRKALVSSRKRAEVMHIILRLGDQIVNFFCRDDDSNRSNDDMGDVAVVMPLGFIDAQRKTEWLQLRDAFMLMLEN